MESGIYIVATPIGNLKDISLRALEVLAAVDCIAAEDTRHTRKLLGHYDINTPMFSLHEHNESQKAHEIIKRVQDGQAIALVSDAGTPLISDPGYVLVSLAREAGIKLVSLPGACALVSALSVAGVPCGRFIFEGFLPAKDGAKKEQLAGYANESRAVVFYESPHRILSTVELIAELYPKRDLVVARELTKQYETVKKGLPAEILVCMQEDSNQTRGEFVVVLGGGEQSGFSIVEEQQREMLQKLLAELPPKKAAALAADLFGGKKRQYYDWAVQMK